MHAGSERNASGREIHASQPQIRFLVNVKLCIGPRDAQRVIRGGGSADVVPKESTRGETGTSWCDVM